MHTFICESLVFFTDEIHWSQYNDMSHFSAQDTEGRHDNSLSVFILKGIYLKYLQDAKKGNNNMDEIAAVQELHFLWEIFMKNNINNCVVQCFLCLFRCYVQEWIQSVKEEPVPEFQKITIWSSRFGEKRREEKRSSFFSPLTQLFNLLFNTCLISSTCFCPLESNTESLLSLSPREEGRVCLSPIALGVWQSGERESRGLCSVKKKRRQTWGRKYCVSRNKDHAFKSLPEIQPSSLFPLPTPWNYSGFDPISLSLSLCSVTHKYVTHALKGINPHFLSCLTQIGRRNCLKSNGYEMDF